MKFRTESGAVYIVEGDVITRLSETPFYDAPDLVVNHRKFEWVVPPKVGSAARYWLAGFRGVVTTTTVVEVMDESDGSILERP